MKKIIIQIITALSICAVVAGIALYSSYKQQKEKEVQKQKLIDANTLKPVKNGEMFTVNGVSFNMINVKGGMFTMGNQNFPKYWTMQSEGYDERLHPYYSQEVTLNDFSIGQTEVTCELWKAVMGDFPIKELTVGSKGQIESRKQEIAVKFPPKYPITEFTYSEFEVFIKKLNELTGQKFRLPTEAEWEYAARGGSMSKGYAFSGSNVIDEVAWVYGNTKGNNKPVMKLNPNELGIYDMSGNVAEICQDRFSWKRNLSQPKIVNLPPVKNPLCTQQSKFRNSNSFNDNIIYVEKGGCCKTELLVYGDGSFTGQDLCPYHRNYCWFYRNILNDKDLVLNNKHIGFRLALSKEQNEDGQLSDITTQSISNGHVNNSDERQSKIPGEYPDASIRILTPSELSGYSKRELKLMRNEIFARHGYIFKTDDMKNHFSSKQWYEPKYNDVNNMLTDIEQQNIKTIQQLEK